MSDKLLWYSLVPGLHSEIGHFYEYTLRLDQAIHINNWQHIVALPSACVIKGLPKTWIKILPIDFSQYRFKIWDWWIKPFVLNFFTISRIVNKVRRKNNSSVIFIEQYNVPFLAALSLAILANRTKSKLLFFNLIRFSPQELKFGGKLYFWLHALIERILGKECVNLFSDSELIAKEFKEKFGLHLHVLPIPHGKNRYPAKNKCLNQLLCWWPGPPREEKGLSHIRKFSLSLANTAIHAKLILADSLKNDADFKFQHVEFVPLMLSRLEYEGWLNKVHFVLLPYLPFFYHSRTSGIFIEAVMAGRLPLVSDGTWMAYELKKFDLNELVIDSDWNESVINKMQLLGENCIVRRKLEAMKRKYEEFHSVDKFAQIIRDLVI